MWEIEMRIYSAGFQPDVARSTLRVSSFVFTVPVIVIATWLVAGTANVASGRPTTQPAALAAPPYPNVIQVSPAAVTGRPAKIAAIDEEDGDDDQADPEDPNDTLAAADPFWWGVAEALRASQTEPETRPGSEAFASQVV
jgi:hypothetical protein